jgi:ferredoxin
MADRNDKVSENIEGRYYVDSSCIDCGVCYDAARENFSSSEQGGYAYVSKQPRNEEEEGRCREALESCPVGAIGDDGE